MYTLIVKNTLSLITWLNNLINGPDEYYKNNLIFHILNREPYIIITIKLGYKDNFKSYLILSR